jgi:porphobilinogen synthase
VSYPEVRFHRYRKNPALREFFAETSLHAGDFISPIFIKEDGDKPQEVSSMPGVYQHSLNSLLDEVSAVMESGVRAVLLFGIPTHKDATGSSSFDANGIIQKSIRLIKKHFPKMIVIADCCLCEYTSHGHCGIMHNGQLDNDATLEMLQQIALSYAHSGVDIIAPSGRMDHKVGAIRHALERSGFPLVPVMSYAVKYASAFYGPFREAGGAGAVFTGDRKHHQMAPSQRREALREVSQDIGEGADMVIIKPGMPYLDIIRDVRESCQVPIVAYQVSGEYAMLKAGAKAQLYDERIAFHECLLAYKRAGADLIISYYAKEICAYLQEDYRAS